MSREKMKIGDTISLTRNNGNRKTPSAIEAEQRQAQVNIQVNRIKSCRNRIDVAMEALEVLGEQMITQEEKAEHNRVMKSL
jgi:putative heme degradation protein